MPYTFGLLAIFKKFIISIGLDTALGVANAKDRNYFLRACCLAWEMTHCSF